MKKKRIVLLATVAAVLGFLGLATYVWAASPGATGGNRPLAMMLGGKLRELNVTDAQRTAVKAAIKVHAPTMMPLVRKLVAERRSLQDLIRAGQPDESAIRAQSARVAAVQAEIAVQSARVAADLRKIATPDQLAKLQELDKSIRERVDRGLDKASEWLARP